MTTPTNIPISTPYATAALPRPPEWTRTAACLGRFDLDWIDPTDDQARHCRAICADCPVRRPCLAAALVAGEPWGIWGGLDVDERAELAREAGLPLPNVLPAHGVNARYSRHGCRCNACRHAHALYESQRRRAHASAA